VGESTGGATFVLCSISAMAEYKAMSVEELRFDDYSRGVRGGAGAVSSSPVQRFAGEFSFPTPRLTRSLRARPSAAGRTSPACDSCAMLLAALRKEAAAKATAECKAQHALQAKEAAEAEAAAVREQLDAARKESEKKVSLSAVVVASLFAGFAVTLLFPPVKPEV